MLVYLVAGLVTALLVPAVPLAVVRRRERAQRAKAEAEAEVVEAQRRQREADEAARVAQAEAAALAAEEAAREAEHVLADPVAAVMVPAGHAITAVVIPVYQARETAAKAVDDIDVKVQEGQEEVDRRADRVPAWLRGQVWQKIVAGAAPFAGPLLALSVLFDWLTFRAVVADAVALAYGLMAALGIAAFSVLTARTAMDLAAGWSTAGPTRRYWMGVGLAGSLLCLGSILVLLFTMADQRSRAESQHGIAVAGSAIETLEGKRAVGDPSFSEAQLASANQALEDARASGERAARFDQYTVLVIALLEMVAIEAAVLSASYLKPHRTAEATVVGLRAEAEEARQELATSQQQLAAVGARVAQDLYTHYEPFGIPDLERVIPEAVARAARLQQVTIGIIDPEDLRPRATRSVGAAVGPPAVEAGPVVAEEPVVMEEPVVVQAEPVVAPAELVVRDRNVVVIDPGPAAPVGPAPQAHPSLDDLDDL